MPGPEQRGTGMPAHAHPALPVAPADPPVAMTQGAADVPPGSPDASTFRPPRRNFPLLLAQGGVDLLQGFGQPVLPAAQRILPRVVGAVRQPDLQVLRPGRAHHLDALQMVRNGFRADLRVLVRQRPEPVVVVLEKVRVHRPDRDAQFLRVRLQRGVVIDLVPRDVNRHLRRQPGHRMHLRRVRDLFPRISRRPRSGEHLEPGPGVPVRPTRHLDAEIVEIGEGTEGVGHGRTSLS